MNPLKLSEYDRLIKLGLRDTADKINELTKSISLPLESKILKKRICNNCGLKIGESGKLYIAGSICSCLKNKEQNFEVSDIKNRLKAIEVLTGGDYGLDAEWYSHFSEKTKKMSREKLEEFIIEFGKIITNCYIISHGFNSKCCKGNGKEIVENLINFQS